MKTILIDIETAPSIAYVWNFWKQTIQHDSVIDYQGYIMSASIKELDSNEIFYLENRTDNDKKIVSDLITVLDKADIVVAHNGKKFDIPFIKARAVIHNIPPPSPFKIVDTLKIAKEEMNFKRNSLEYLAEALGVATKLKHNKFPGIHLWKECMAGNDEAWKEMEAYNIRDVEVLEQIYKKLKPWYGSHPNVNVDEDKTQMRCPKCGSNHLNKRGYYYTNKGQYQRYVCLDCKGWSSETYTANTLAERKNLLKGR